MIDVKFSSQISKDKKSDNVCILIETRPHFQMQNRACRLTASLQPSKTGQLLWPQAKGSKVIGQTSATTMTQTVWHNRPVQIYSTHVWKNSTSPFCSACLTSGFNGWLWSCGPNKEQKNTKQAPMIFSSSLKRQPLFDQQPESCESANIKAQHQQNEQMWDNMHVWLTYLKSQAIW